MIYREATVNDIAQMHTVRVSVNENRLSNPALVTEKHYKEFITIRGKGWICETKGRIVGFSVVDLRENNIWALFVHPDYEAKGIGSVLQKKMLDWYFSQTTKKVWLGTAPGTKAEKFYQKRGWTKIALQPNGEMRFEMTFDNWIETGI